MFCFGYEQRGKASAGLLATGVLSHAMHAVKNAEDAQKFVETVMIYTDNNMESKVQIEDLLQTESIRVDNRKVEKLGRSDEHRIDMQVYFEDGSFENEAFIVHKPGIVLNEELIENLGLDRMPSGEIKTTSPFNSTNVPGVYAAGDCASPLKQIPNALPWAHMLVAVLQGSCRGISLGIVYGELEARSSAEFCHDGSSSKECSPDKYELIASFSAESMSRDF